jgi:hypothetical protein
MFKLTGENSLMQRILKTAVIAALFGGLMCAQGPGGTPPNPATMIAHQVARLTTLLELTATQAAQATTILTAAQTSISALEATVHTDQTSLRTAVTTNNTATIDQLAVAIGTVDGQILAARSQAEAAFYAILTATQVTKLDTIGGPGLLGGGPGGFGGPGGRGGPRP